MPADVSDVSNETSILASLDNLLPSVALRVLVPCTLVLALLLYILRKTALSKATRNLHTSMISAEWIYFSSAEAGLFDGHGENIYRELAE